MTEPDITAAAIARLRLAASDPGAIVGRRLHPSWGDGNDGYSQEAEYVSEWIGRALTVVLTELLDSNEKQVREKVAREIEQHADKQSVQWPHRWTMDKLIGWQGAADVARGSRPAADGGGVSE